MMDAAQYMNNRISRWDGNQKDKVFRREIKGLAEPCIDGKIPRQQYLRDFTEYADYATAQAKELPE